MTALYSGIFLVHLSVSSAKLRCATYLYLALNGEVIIVAVLAPVWHHMSSQWIVHVASDGCCIRVQNPSSQLWSQRGPRKLSCSIIWSWWCTFRTLKTTYIFMRRPLGCWTSHSNFGWLGLLLCASYFVHFKIVVQLAGCHENCVYFLHLCHVALGVSENFGDIVDWVLLWPPISCSFLDEGHTHNPKGCYNI